MENRLLHLVLLVMLLGLIKAQAQQGESPTNAQNKFLPNTSETIYKKVEINLNNNADIESIAQMGIDLHCGANITHKDGKDIVTLELSSLEYNQIKDKLPTKVLIDDLSAFYVERNINELPEAKKSLKTAQQASLKNAQVGQDLGCVEDNIPVPQNFKLGSMGGFTTFQEMQDELDLMASLYPNLITTKASASNNGITTHEGRTLYYVKISDNPYANENEPEVLYTGLHHSREPVSMMNMLYYMWYLLENYSTDPTVKNIVDNTEMFFIPIVNPDGYVYNQTTNPNGGGMWRKNRRNNGDGTYGVDLNRNYGYNWGYNNIGSSGTTSSDTYRGTSAFSEPETQIIKEFAESHNFINAFNNHSYSNLLLHAWGHITTPTPDEELFDEISEHMCWHNRYNYGNSLKTINYQTNGDASDWFYGEQSTKNKTLGWIPEIGTSGEGGFWPSPSSVQLQCARQLRMSIILAESASNYGVLNDLTPYGLENLNTSLTFNIEHLSVTPGSFTVGIASSNPYVQNISNANLTTPTLTGANDATVSTGITLASTTPPGTAIDFTITLNNGVYDIYTTTITKLYNPIKVFYDDCSNMNNWSSTSWSTDNTTGYNANGSITDSPSGNTLTGTSFIELNNSIDLSQIQNPVLEYYTKWDVFRLFDYAQLQVSTDGNNWSDLCGNYTKVGVGSLDFNTGTPDQIAGEAVYDGYQKNWVREEIDLSAYAGSNSLYFRFKMRGDTESAKLDGFYFDDFTIYREPLSHCDDGVLNADETGIDCGGVDCIACVTCTDGIQNGNETGIDCGPGCGSICAEICPPYNFNNQQVFSYDPGQDFGPHFVDASGLTLYMGKNAWKAIEINYTFTPNTVIEFDFKSTIEGEIHEIGFDNDLIVAPDHRIVVYGNQGYSGTFNNPVYSGSGNYEHFAISLGSITGTYQYLVLSADDDANAVGESYYQNVKIYEDLDGNLICDQYKLICNIGTACDDNNPCTIGETYDTNCECVGGIFQDADNDGICDANDVCPNMDDSLVGTTCDDNDACTTGETYDVNCNCIGGTFQDADNDGVCDADDVCATGDDTLDADNDGVPDACDNCDNSLIGTACNDNDICTTGETYDTNCNCTGGTFQDSDNDGVCDANDVCPNLDDNLVGLACDDNNPCTTGETYDSNCNCTGGLLEDSDNDGVCDADDICPTGDDNLDVDNDGIPDACDACDASLIGAACNDNDPCTTGETYDTNCNCTGGTFQDADNDGVCDANDVCPNLDDSLVGLACDDNNPCTTGETYDTNCNCTGGLLQDADNDGVCNADDICPTGDDNLDADNDGIPDACDACDASLIGTACNDNDPCTIGETYDANCDCTGGIFQDTDNDGVCDANDVCPNMDDGLAGMACDDNDPCTTGDVYDSNCNCMGTFQDADNDGVCDANDICATGDDTLDADNDGTPDACDTCDGSLIGTSCNDYNPCTTGETYDSNCNCAGGTFQDTDNDGVCDANDVCPNMDDGLVGLACNDNDPCTTGDVYDSSCNCIGTFQDSDNDGVCDVNDVCSGTDDNLIGTACDDNNPCTTGDVYSSNCNCAGTFQDSDNDSVCDANDDCPNDPTNNCNPPTYCDSNGQNVSYEYIESVTIKSINNTSGSDGGYADFTNLSTTATLGETINFELVPGFASSAYNEYWEIWIDFNRDGDFDDADESVYSGSSNSSLIGTFDISNNATAIGITRIRVSMKYSAAPTSCEVFTYGEVEDYNISIINNCPDSDNDGVCDANDVCPNLDDNLIGTICNDNDPCTTGDVYDSNCNCSGTFQDTDNDGVCNANDVCATGDDTLDADNDGIPDACDNCDANLTGTACDDNDACTTGDVYDSNCNCLGTFQDADSDGVCDANDVCPNMDDSLVGMACNDNDVCTTGDVYDSNCNCSGTFQDADNDGVCDANDICATGDDTLDGDGDGTPDACDTCDANLTGTACNDNDPCTTGDTYDANCNCLGIFQDADNDGVCDADDVCPTGDDTLDGDGDGTPDACDTCDDSLTGTTCDDNDPCTTGDVYDSNCNCSGTFQDTDNDGVCDANDVCATGDDTLDGDGDGTPDACDTCDDSLIGTTCDDNDACTTGDIYDSNCNCLGTFQDADNDGVCDADDVCPNMDDNLVGLTCDDNDVCTTDDVYDANCNCLGTFQDSDNDGVCDADDICATGDDALDADNDGTPDACDTCDDSLIGTTCNDNDPCTIGETYDTNCNCTGGTFQDTDNDGVCDANDVCAGTNDNVIGTTCNDNDSCTTGDVYDSNCNCVGTFQDSDNDGICDTDDICPGIDDNDIGTACDDNDPCTIDDTYDTNCNCVGIYTDFDEDGVCVGDDPNDNDACDPNSCNTCGTYNSESFENGLGIWNDGGGDCRVFTYYGSDGTKSIELQDNSGVASSIYTNNLDLSNYTSLEFSFSCYPSDMEVNEDFFLEVSTNGGASYTIEKEWNSGTEFTNNNPFYETVDLSYINFTSTTRFRLRCDASTNADRVYLDEVIISGCTEVAARLDNSENTTDLTENCSEKGAICDLKAIPSIASSNTLIYFNSNYNLMANIQLRTIDGKLMQEQTIESQEGHNTHELNLSNIPSGIYLVMVQIRGEFQYTRIVKQ